MSKGQTSFWSRCWDGGRADGDGLLGPIAGRVKSAKCGGRALYNGWICVEVRV